MLIAQAKSLFARDCLEDSPLLKTIRDLLATLPDGPLRESPTTAFNALLAELGWSSVRRVFRDHAGATPLLSVDGTAP